jgi:hypothetical protein
MLEPPLESHWEMIDSMRERYAAALKSAEAGMRGEEPPAHASRASPMAIRAANLARIVNLDMSTLFNNITSLSDP